MKAVEFDKNGLKKCTRCGIAKTKEDFYPNPEYKCGFRPDCKECCKKNKKPKTKEQSKNSSLRRYYGITLNDYHEMFKEQEGVCAICGEPQIEQNRGGRIVTALSVDHNHDNGKVRGLLCMSCNLGLGSFKDNKMNLLKAAIYLEKSELK